MSRWKSLKTLRAEVARIERGGAAGRGGDALSLGVAEIDAALGEGGLHRAALHEISGAAADGFAAMLAGRLGGAVLWCMARRGGGDLYPPALGTFGLDPSRLVLVRCRKRAGMLSAMEEGLRCSGLAAVLGEVDRPPDMIAGRRLQLAAEEGGVTGFMLLHGAMAPIHPPSPAASRWRVDHAAGGAGDGARWRLALLHCRGGGAGAWTVEWNEKTLRLAVVPRTAL